MERRLAAILITDMVGYSRMMASNEADVFARQQKLRLEVIDPKIAEYGGRIIKSTGDGVLVMFHSVVDALRCAVMLQLEITEREAFQPLQERLVYRIGVNLGDIILEDGDIYGDGVNVAARLVQVAEPGGICIAETVVSQVKGRVSSGFEFQGEQRLKNLPDPVRLYHVKMVPEKPADRQMPLKIGDFTFNPKSGVITDANGEIVHIRSQSQKVLAVLAETPDKLVTKDKLISEVWNGIATTDDSLVQCITDIRRTIGRGSIETFPKKGYRLRIGNATSAPAPAIAPNKKRYVWPAIVFLFLMSGASIYLLWPSDPSEDSQTLDIIGGPSDIKLAVLPFTNLSGDPELRYFSNGLSEDLTTDLSKVPDLTVISYASSVELNETEQAFSRIAESLGVRYLVRGTVRHHGDRVRINVSLIDTGAGSNLWAERYDRDTRNPFDVQEEIARNVAETLSLTLGSKATEQRRVEPDAFYMLLRGLEKMRTYSPSGNAEARKYFEQALEFDPDYARAYANIAISYGRETEFRYSEGISIAEIQKGLEAAITAIRLNPNLPDAYFALGILNLALNDYDKALAAARHSIKLDKNYSDGYALLAEAGVYGGDLSEALAAIRNAKLLHPKHPATYDWVEGHILFQLERYEEAKPLLEGVVEQTPDFLRAWLLLAATNGQLLDLEEASFAYMRAQGLLPEIGSGKAEEFAWYVSEERRANLRNGLEAANQELRKVK
ncbi:tetratricopeptide repeat protein (plasmid) [Ruegeria conchae]|uniref:tetratricopeptide repeat protein n=1 Tax=Ruegeria conchae TaxID=981384 RepID=UPI0021A65CC5|nr:tetratricopeptide repeat protein [Ruegeria conchae]UWR05208.1 tetratricopeptide repeat protein [Ruegeria conchae]